MAEHSRYNVSEEENTEVLKNKLALRDQKTLQNIETLLLSDAYEEFFALLEARKLRFNVKLILQIHEYFLTTLYSWAGKIRSVEISKDGILFCASLQIKKELKKLEVIIKNNVPNRKDDKKSISRKMAIIHCEFNAIHPFREGNGRTIRLFLDLLAVQSGYGLIDYGKILKKSYIKACIAGMHGDYTKMQKILHGGLNKSTNS